MIARARLTPFSLRLRSPFATARGTLRERGGVFVELESTRGAAGIGEAMPLPGFGTETHERCQDALLRMARELVGRGGEDLGRLRSPVFELAYDAPAARCAIDVALCDLDARERGLDVSELLCLQSDAAAPLPRAGVPVNAVISDVDPEAAAEAAKRARDAGFRTLKLKVGATSLDLDAERVAAVRSAAGSDLRLRLDANGVWKEAEARCALERLAAYRIEFIEQPLAAEEVDGLARLRAASPIPIAADESVTGEAAAHHLIAAQAVDILVLKPPTLGGLGATLRVAARANDAGLEVVVTSFLDSSVGIAAALHTACAMPRTLACGLATADLLERDLGRGPLPEDGVMSRSREVGLGVFPGARDVAACAQGRTLEITP